MATVTQFIRGEKGSEFRDPIPAWSAAGQMREWKYSQMGLGWGADLAVSLWPSGVCPFVNANSGFDPTSLVQQAQESSFSPQTSGAVP